MFFKAISYHSFQYTSFFFKYMTLLKTLKAYSEMLNLPHICIYGSYCHYLFLFAFASGKVTVSEPLDRELSAEFFLTVLATDQGSPPLTASTVLSVNVTDVNDNAPRFSQDAYTLHVSEAARVGAEIFKVNLRLSLCSLAVFVKLYRLKILYGGKKYFSF